MKLAELEKSNGVPVQVHRTSNSDRCVEYSCSGGSSSSNEIRPTTLTYPNSRVLTNSYGTSGGANDRLNRVDALQDTTGATAALAAYTYLGAGSVIRADYATPQVRLDRWGGTSGVFTGLDQFSRVASQTWNNYGTAANVFQINYGYDRDSNRLHAQNTVQKGSSQVYTYDQLNRLLTYKAGSIKSDFSDIAPNWTLDATRWTLDATGNQTAVDYYSSYNSNSFAWQNWFKNTANTVNEYTTRKSFSGAKGRLYDYFAANTTANWTCPGSGDSFTIDTTAKTLTVTAVARDTIDGVLEPGPQAIILTGEMTGPMTPQVSFTIPSGTTTGQIGLVFGYKSGADYWIWARDMAGTANVYHVVSGTKTLVASTSYPAPVAGGTTNIAFYDGAWAFTGWAPLYGFGTGGFPEGQIGLYTTIVNTAFSQFSSFDATPTHVCGRWINDSSPFVNTTVHGLELTAGSVSGYNAILLENMRLQKFQATFALTRDSSQSVSIMGLVFNAADRGNFDYVQLTHSATVSNPVAYTQAAAGVPTVASGGSNPTNIPTCASGDTLWCRVQYDGTTLTAKAINSSTAPSESTWTSTTACYSNTSLTIVGGQFGYVCSGGIGYINNFTLKSYDNATSSFDITEHWDNFTTDGSGFASDTLTYDAAGNLTYDGQQQYTYDAWNRLISVAHAYRDSGGAQQHGQTFDLMAYDGLSRRISKTVSNIGQWDCAYNYYYDRWRLIETRNGSSQTLKQHVWAPRGTTGGGYIDELVQVCANSNPSSGNTCSGWFWAMQDANFNVLGLVNSSGALVERYEYTPYGQRKVFFPAGNTWAGGTSTNDPGCYARAYYSPRYTSNAPYFGLCDIGHQGLMHDEESGLLYNRLRIDNLAISKFLTRDPLEYDYGLNLYEYAASAPTYYVDPSGSRGVPPRPVPGPAPTPPPAPPPPAAAAAPAAEATEASEIMAEGLEIAAGEEVVGGGPWDPVADIGAGGTILAFGIWAGADYLIHALNRPPVPRPPRPTKPASAQPKVEVCEIIYKYPKCKLLRRYRDLCDYECTCPKGFVHDLGGPDRAFRTTQPCSKTGKLTAPCYRRSWK